MLDIFFKLLKSIYLKLTCNLEENIHYFIFITLEIHSIQQNKTAISTFGILPKKDEIGK